MAGVVVLAATVLTSGVVEAGGSEPDGEPAAGLVEVATSDRQWTGVAVSKTGRVFVNFPRWQPTVTVSVGEIDDAGHVVPYPNESINRWSNDADPKESFVCVQSVYVDAKDRLWILDPANPLFSLSTKSSLPIYLTRPSRRKEVI
jgi:hypothetical protein